MTADFTTTTAAAMPAIAGVLRRLAMANSFTGLLNGDKGLLGHGDTDFLLTVATGT